MPSQSSFLLCDPNGSRRYLDPRSSRPPVVAVCGGRVGSRGSEEPVVISLWGVSPASRAAGRVAYILLGMQAGDRHRGQSWEPTTKAHAHVILRRGQEGLELPVRAGREGASLGPAASRLHLPRRRPDSHCGN